MRSGDAEFERLLTRMQLQRTLLVGALELRRLERQDRRWLNPRVRRMLWRLTRGSAGWMIAFELLLRLRKMRRKARPR